MARDGSFQPRFESLVEIYEHAISKYKDQPLFGTKVGGDWQWMTYAEFQTHTDELRGGLAALGVGVGAWTRAMKQRRERAVTERWSKMPEREALSKLERKLEPRWKRFAAKLLEDTGFRVELRVGDVHEAERLLSLDPAKLADPATWEPDPGENDVRYGWAFADGRVLEQQAELEDTGAEVSDVEPARDEEE